jgi:hypothetical protein
MKDTLSDVPNSPEHRTSLLQPHLRTESFAVQYMAIQCSKVPWDNELLSRRTYIDRKMVRIKI